MKVPALDQFKAWLQERYKLTDNQLATVAADHFIELAQRLAQPLDKAHEAVSVMAMLEDPTPVDPINFDERLDLELIQTLVNKAKTRP